MCFTTNQNTVIFFPCLFSVVRDFNIVAFVFVFKLFKICKAVHKIHPGRSNIHLCCLQLASPSLRSSVFSFWFILPLFPFESSHPFLHKKYTLSTSTPCFFHLNRYSGDHSTVMHNELFRSFLQLYHIAILEGCFSCFQFLL